MDINDIKNSWNSMNIPPDYRHEDTRELLSRVERGKRLDSPRPSGADKPQPLAALYHRYSDYDTLFS